MVTVHGTWTEAEVLTFLKQVHIPIRIGVRTPDGTPWIVAVWFRYRDEHLECVSASSSHLVRMLRKDAAVAFDISTNDIPYRGVRGNGTVTLRRDENFDVLRALITRYLGDTESGLAQRLLDEDREEICIRISPDRIYSWDFADRMRGIQSS